MSFSCLKTAFLFFTIIVVLFSFSSVAFASTFPEVEDTNWFVKIFNWCRGLIVPAEDFFPNELNKLSTLLNEKVGGIGYLFKMVREFWNDLGSDVRNISFSIPDNHFFAGYKGININPLSEATHYISFFRGVFSVFISITTAIFCYKKLITLFSV